MYKVLADWKGSADGFTVVDYATGQTVELTARLAEVALAEGWVEKVSAAAPAAPVNVSRKRR